MLNASPYEQNIAARLLDFFGSKTQWHRALWSPSTVLTLKEVAEASEGIQAGILKDASLKNLVGCAQSLCGPDPGVGSDAEKRTLLTALRSDIRANGTEHRIIKNLTRSIDEAYLLRWAIALRTGAAPGAERTARAIAAHLLDKGFSAPFLHRWWTYRMRHEAAMRSMADVLEDAHNLVQRPMRTFRVLVAFEAAAPGKSGMPAGWVTPRELSQWLTTNGFDVSRVRQNGGMWFEVSSPDPWAAVESVVETVDKLTSRVALGTIGRLQPVSTAWVEGEPNAFRFAIGRRRVEVHALHREDQLYRIGKTSIVDAAIELLGPFDSGSPSPAITGGWAAIEALLSGPGDDDVIAADRMATLVACSFTRAELTLLSYKAEATGGPLSVSLARCATNRDRAALLAAEITQGRAPAFTNPSDAAALERVRAVLNEPHPRLRDVEGHVTTVFRRLYRQRNLILHWGKTDAVAIRSTLRTSAPLVGAGMDRIAHAWFVDSIQPIELVARARIALDLVGVGAGSSPVDLLM